MKRAIILTAIGLLCFVLGIVGIYLAMPSLAPDRVDATRARLDSLGLLQSGDSTFVGEALPDTLRPDSSAVDSINTTAPPTPQDIIQGLQDSISVSNNLIRDLQADTTELRGRLGELLAQVDELTEKDIEATELSQSVTKLDAKQLGNILAGLDLNTVQLLYEKASARDRTKLLESMNPEQAARFVSTLVRGEPPDEAETDAPAENPDTPADPTDPT
ncbi:MAG: hypothetical protein WD423_04795 [Rhodothermales bacterium]